MIDTAARALCLAQSGEECFDSLEPEAQELAREHVRAVLRALWQPSEAMVFAGASADVGEGFSTSEWMGEAWKAMVDALLAE